MTGIIRLLDDFTRWVGERVMWLTSALVGLIFVDVLLRYLFSSPKAWRVELEWHLFALVFLLGASYCMLEDKHVRVDVFYAKWSDSTRAWVNFVGTIMLLLPWCVMVIYTSFNYAEHSYAIRETSPDPGGLPARYLIKFAICLGFVLLAVQATSLALRSIRQTRSKAS